MALLAMKKKNIKITSGRFLCKYVLMFICIINYHLNLESLKL